MNNKMSGFKDKTMLAALLSVTLACGSVNTQEVAQSKAVRDRSRVLGLALMDDGTYQFRLCRLHKTYTAEILSNECINPLINEDGTARVFSDVPARPGTVLAKFRNWFAASLAGAIASFIIYKVGRFFVKIKGRDRIVGKARLANHEARVSGAKARSDFELVESIRDKTEGNSTVVGGKDFANAITFIENYSTKIENNIAASREAIEAARSAPFQADLDNIQKILQEAREALQQADSSFNINKDLAQKIDTLVKHADELNNVSDKELPDKLQAMESEARTIYERVHGKEGLRLQLSRDDKQALFDVAEEDSAVAAALRNWKHDQAELSLLDGSDELKKVFLNLKDSKDELVEKLLRIDDVVVKNNSSSGENSILQLKQAIDTYSKAVEANKKELAELSDADDEASTALKDSIKKDLAKRDEAEAALKTRIKSYNSVMRETEIKQYQEKIDAAINFDPVAEKVAEAETLAKAGRGGGEGLLADGLGKVGNSIKGRVKFMRGFPWIDEDTLKYGKLNRITITDEETIVAKLSHGVEVKDVEIQQGVEKLAAQVVGISAFLSLPLTEWSRYLPAHALLSAEKNWTEVTGGYATSKRIDNMLTILDGIAQATNSKVSPAAITLGL